MEGDTIPGGLRHGSRGDDNSKVLQSFESSFLQVQSILDQNRLLIDEIHQNQVSRASAGLSRNVGLIRELNTNIWRVVDLYAQLSASYAKSAEAPSDGESTGTPMFDGKTGGGKRARLG